MMADTPTGKGAEEMTEEAAGSEPIRFEIAARLRDIRRDRALAIGEAFLTALEKVDAYWMGQRDVIFTGWECGAVRLYFEAALEAPGHNNDEQIPF